MEISKAVEMLVSQIVSIAWLRSCLEVGVTFTNKETGQSEDNELFIYDSFLRQLDLFDVPDVRMNPKIIEKNIYEVVGSYLLKNKNHDLRKTLVSVHFMEAMQQKLQTVREKKR
jgi:hypothetical protein